jgi:hypothetical protein
MVDQGALNVNMDPATGLVTITVREPLSIITHSVQVLPFDFQQVAATVLVAIAAGMNAATKGALVQVPS